MIEIVGLTPTVSAICTIWCANLRFWAIPPRNGIGAGWGQRECLVCRTISNISAKALDVVESFLNRAANGGYPKGRCLAPSCGCDLHGVDGVATLVIG